MRSNPAVMPRAAEQLVGAIVAAALVFGAQAGTADAAQPVRESLATIAAGAASMECAGTLCTATALFVVSSNDGPAEACLDIQTFEISGPGTVRPISIESGCAVAAVGALSFDTRDLSGAALSATPIVVRPIVCDITGCIPTGTGRTVTVSATINAIGPLATFKGKITTTFGNCTMHFSGRGSSREGQASLVIDGRSIESLGFLSTSTQKTRTTCR